MWDKFAFLFLYLFTFIYVFNTEYHHVNEVFNAFSHDHLYSVTKIDIFDEEVYFDKPATRELVKLHFKTNLKNVTYVYHIVFYSNGEPCAEEINSKYFSMQLIANINFNYEFNKTFNYYIT